MLYIIYIHIHTYIYVCVYVCQRGPEASDLPQTGVTGMYELPDVGGGYQTQALFKRSNVHSTPCPVPGFSV